VAVAAACAHPATTPPAPAHLEDALARLPLHFESNRGQAPPDVRFIARAATGAILLTADGFVVAAEGPPVSVSFAARRPGSVIEALEPLPGRINYYLGRDAANWRGDIPTYGRVRYADVYPGIDVVVYGNQRRLEYDFVVAPGADPGAIALRVKGAERLTVDSDGHLVITRPGSTIVQQAPLLYQERGHRRERVAGRYVVRGNQEVAFAIGPYDRTRPLVIDPVIVYSTRIGVGIGRHIAVDSAGAVYITGENAVPGGAGYPLVNPAFQHQPNGFEDIFVTKLSPGGNSLVYSTFIGGFWRDFVNGIGVDGSNNAYIAGRTHNDFPTTPGSFQPEASGGEDPFTPFVAKFSSTGALLYSTFLQGTTFDGDPIQGNNCVTGSANGLAVDMAGSAYVTGVTTTTNFPTTSGAYKRTPPAATNCLQGGGAWVAKLSPSGASLVYSTYMDGAGMAVAVNGSGQAFTTGPLTTASFTVHSVAAGSATSGGAVVKLAVSGQPLFGTIIGPVADAVATGGDGSAYVSGVIGASPNPAAAGFVPQSGFQTVRPGGEDGFAGRLHPTGTSWVWATYVGGSAADTIAGIAAASDGGAWLVGSSASTNFPTKAPLRAKAAATEVVTLKISALGALDFGTFLGDGEGHGIAVDATRNAYLTGVANGNFPTTPGAYKTTPSGSGDVFVLKVNETTDSPTKPTVSITAGAPAREAGPTAGTFTVRRTGSTAAVLTVRYTVGGTAAPGSDYTRLSGSVTIAAGSATATIAVTPVNDAVMEPPETVIVQITAGAAYTVGSPGSATLTIESDETVRIAATDPTATEAGRTTGTVTVTRTGNTAAALTVRYTVAGTATAGSDYVALSGQVVIPAGSATATVTVTPIDDAVMEGPETVVVRLATNASYTVGTPSSATVTIGSNETVSVSATDATATEAGPTTGRFTVRRTGPTTAALTVRYTMAGTATQATDYRSLSGSVTIPAGAALATVIVTPVNDSLKEGPETVVIRLAANPAYTVGSPSSATVTIADND
jgi:hypothetical protein